MIYINQKCTLCVSVFILTCGPCVSAPEHSPSSLLALYHAICMSLYSLIYRGNHLADIASSSLHSYVSIDHSPFKLSIHFPSRFIRVCQSCVNNQCAVHISWITCTNCTLLSTLPTAILAAPLFARLIKEPGPKPSAAQYLQWRFSYRRCAPASRETLPDRQQKPIELATRIVQLRTVLVREIGRPANTHQIQFLRCVFGSATAASFIDINNSPDLCSVYRSTARQ